MEMSNVIANLSNDNICIGILYSEDRPFSENDVFLGVLDDVKDPISYIGQQYNRETKVWSTPMYKYYAKIKNGIVTSIMKCLDSSSEQYTNDIRLLSNITTMQEAESYIGKRYDKDKNMFVAVAPEPTQLDRIETEIKKKIADIAKQAVDNYTAELLEQGVI